MPAEFRLNPAKPNPFNPMTTISFELPTETHVLLIVYDIIGREVAQLVNEKKPAGKHTVLFDGTRFASGVYVYRFEVAGSSRVGKMILAK